MPDSHSRRQAFEQPVARVLDRKKPALALRARVTFTRFEPLHQPDLRPVRECNLLVPATHAEYRLTRPLDHLKHASQRFRRVLIPRMTLSTQDDVRRLETADSLERNGMKRFGEDLEIGNQTAQHRANLSRAVAVSIDGVVDEVNEQSYFRQ